MAKKGPKAEQEQTRRSRAEELRKAQRRQEQRRGLMIWSAVGVVVLLIAGGTAYGVYLQTSARDAFAEDVVEYPDIITEHVSSPVDYTESPPVGGRHNPVWLNCGVYTEPVQKENAVHSLEHGAVWVTYEPDLPEADVQKLVDAMPPTYGILSPYDGEMPGPVVASSWGRQIVLDGADDPRLEQFIREYTQSSDVPEPGAACTGGTDTATPLSGDPVSES